MAKYGTYTNLTDLKEWFDDAAEKTNTTEWILYHGHILKAAGVSGNRNAEQRDENMSAEESWNLLETVISAQSKMGGNFTLYMPTKGTNVGQRCFISIAQPGSNLPGIAGIYGPEYVEDKINAFKEKFLLEQQIKELREEMNAKKNPLAEVAQQLLDSGIVGAIVQGYASKLLGIDTAQMSGVSYNEMDNTQNEIEMSLQRIAQVFPNLPEVLAKIASFVERDPTTAKMVFNNMAKMNSENGGE